MNKNRDGTLGNLNADCMYISFDLNSDHGPDDDGDDEIRSARS